MKKFTDQDTARIVNAFLQVFFVDFDARPNDFPYVRGKYRFRYDPKNRTQTEKIVHPYDYEKELLYQLFPQFPEPYSLNRPTVILGGRGSGKSTTIRYVLKQLGKFEDAFSAIFDFNNWDHRKDEEQELPKMANRFFGHISEVIRASIPLSVTESQEINGFYPWIVSNRAYATHVTGHIDGFPSFLNKFAGYITAASKGQPVADMTSDKVYNFLFQRRLEMISNFSAFDWIWYNTLLLIWARGWPPLHADIRHKLLVVDNIDPLHPYLQQQTLRLFSDITRSTGILTLIPMRPYTKSQLSVITTDHFERVDHCAPRISNVLRGRLNFALRHLNIPEAKGLAARFFQLVETHGKELDEAMRGSCGLDVRSALIGFNNFVEKLVKSKGTEFDPNRLKVSEIVGAYFLNEEFRCDDAIFCDLYFVEERRRKISFVKWWILYFLIERHEGEMNFNELKLLLQAAGCDQVEFLIGMNDLLWRERSLVWSSSGFDANSFSNDSVVYASPAGAAYWRRLFGELFYIEICIALQAKRYASVQEALSFEREVVAADMTALIAFVKSFGPERSRMYFRYSDSCIGFRHWEKFFVGLRSRDDRKEFQHVDALRRQWLRQSYDGILDGRVTNLAEISQPF